MLFKRFEFSGRWDDAFSLQTWLSLTEINNFKNNDYLVQLINLRVENWNHVPPASIGLSNTTIFGFDPYGTNETYLEWIDGKDEPRIWYYIDGDYHMFNNLENFLKYATGECKKDDLSELI